MESLFTDYPFGGGFPELSDKKFDSQKHNEPGTSNDLFDFGKHDTASKSKNTSNDLLNEITFNVKSEPIGRRSSATFDESDFKYLLNKSPVDNEYKKNNKNKKETEEEEREKMQVLVSNFTEEQLDRYEMFRRAAFPKASIKRIMQVITGNSVSQNVVIAMSGIAKVFVGEIVEEALDIMEAQHDAGPLQPKHLREAARRLRAKGKIPSLREKKPNYRF